DFFDRSKDTHSRRKKHLPLLEGIAKAEINIPLINNPIQPCVPLCTLRFTLVRSVYIDMHNPFNCILLSTIKAEGAGWFGPFNKCYGKWDNMHYGRLGYHQTNSRVPSIYGALSLFLVWEQSTSQQQSSIMSRI
ncbi:hypothetical protein MBGDF03_01145, partial [Thermoplasmatales archaeon SCGC AB-540-F20]